MNLSNFIVKQITYEETKPFILNMHYAQRMPSITWAYGLFFESEILGVVTFGKSASPALTSGILGSEYKHVVYELNRLVLKEDLPKNTASFFVSKALKDLKKHNLCIVSFSDLGMKHHGYIYQALNFYFTGTSKGRTDKYVPNGKHSRHYDKNAKEVYRSIRSQKNRYVYFACDKKHKKEYLNKLNYPILEYPKGNNSKYILGERETKWIKIVETGEIIDESKILKKDLF